MNSEEKQEDGRIKFYNSPAVIKYIKAHGIPKTHQAFRDIVGSGSSGETGWGEGHGSHRHPGAGHLQGPHAADQYHGQDERQDDFHDPSVTQPQKLLILGPPGVFPATPKLGLIDAPKQSTNLYTTCRSGTFGIGYSSLLSNCVKCV